MMDTAIEPDWLRSAMKYSSSTAASYSSPLDGPGVPQRDPKFQKIVKGMHYSQGLILTYPLVILSVVVLVSILHWVKKAHIWRRGRSLQLQVLREDDGHDGTVSIKNFQHEDRPADLDVGSSSGSSTLEGTEDTNLGIKNIDEETPLFHDGYSLRPLHSRRSVVGLIQAFLIYQPPPIPVVNKVFPSNGYTISIIGFIALNVFYTFFHINFNMLEVLVFADRCGLVFVANLPVLYILAAKTQPLEFFTGYSYESLNIIHRRLGELLCLEALLHSVGMVFVWYIIIRPVGVTLIRFLLDRMILLGMASFITYEMLYFTSLASFRRRWYELFLASHVFLQATALVLLFFHHPNSRVYVGIALGIFLVDRLVYRLVSKSVTLEATGKIMEDGETVLISTSFPLQSGKKIKRFMGRNITEGWRASDHVFLSIQSMGWKHMLQAHPFTIKSPAPIAGDSEANLELLIRAQQGFSSDLLQEAMQRASFTVRIAGPYGSSHCRSLLEASDVSMFVAGGSGIAVTWPLLNFLLQEQPHRKIILLWVVHHRQHISWIGWPALQEVSKRGVEVVIPPATEEVGRPDLRSVMRDLISEDSHGKRIAIVGSGPDSMGRTVRNTCAELVKNGWNIGITIEKFGW